jgi:manganese oxidase
MGTTGMAEMAEMSMPLPANTLPMMTGTGPFGPMEMGGMFTVVKVREGLAPGDYRDPGWYQHPKGTVAHEVDASTAGGIPSRQGGGTSAPASGGEPPMPRGHEHHH